LRDKFLGFCLSGRMNQIIFSSDEAERAVLERVQVRLIGAEERERWDAAIEQNHYLKNARLVGEQLRYVAEVDGQWVALLGWSAGSYHLRERETWIGWDVEQRRQRLPLVANNARFLIVQPGRWPNLGSRVLALCLGRLAQDWQALYGHTILVVESFVDSQLFRGTAYKANGWEALGKTAGFQRVAEDFYVAHERPKQLWVKALQVQARGWLRAPSLPESLAEQLTPLLPKCRTKAPALGSLWERLHRSLPDKRSAEGLRHKQATVLTIVLLALMCGVTGGYWNLEDFAQGLNQGQRRRLRCWRHPRTGRYEVPDETTFFRVLKALDPVQLGQLLVQWETDRCGWAEGGLLGIDGKAIRHGGQHLLGAVDLKSGRTLRLESVDEKTNEIPVAQGLLADWQLDGQVAVLDALHTQLETARLIVQSAGGDYLLTIKGNQKGLQKSAQTLLPEGVPPYTCGDRDQSQSQGASGHHGALDQRRATGTAAGDAVGQAGTDGDPSQRQAHARGGVAGDQFVRRTGRTRALAATDPGLLGNRDRSAPAFGCGTAGRSMPHS
jgi:hypothetical protein